MAYDAFISYSHAADGTLAPALQSALHRFAKPWYKLRALRVFRDETNLAVNPALWSSIREALDQSQFFILLASPEAAASPWVAKEAEYWITNNGLSHFLIVLTGGDLQWNRSGNCFAPEAGCALPPNLLRSFAEEPLYVDLRWARGTKRLRLREPRFHEAVLQLASTLRHRAKDELDSADIRFQQHTRWLAAAASLALLLAVLTALRQTGVSKQVGQKNLADALAARSAKVLADNPDRAREAALLAIESDRLNPSFESNQALRTAAALLPAGAQSYPPEDPSPEERVRDLEFSPDGTKLAVTRDNGSTQLIDVVSRKSLGYFGPDDRPAAQIDVRGESPGASLDNDSAVSAAFNSTGSQLASGSRDGLVHVWAIDGGRELLRIVHGAPVSQIAFHPKINQLVTAAEDGHVRIFDVGGAKLLADFQCPGKIGSASFSPTGDVVAALSEGGVSLFDLANRKLLRTMASGEAPFTLSFSKDGKRLDAAAGDFAYVWDVAGGQQLLKATHAASSETLIPTRWIVSAAISPDGKFMAYAARGDKLARVWNVDTGRQILELKHDSLGCRSCLQYRWHATRNGILRRNRARLGTPFRKGDRPYLAWRRFRSGSLRPRRRSFCLERNGRIGLRLRSAPRRSPRLLRFGRRSPQRRLQPGRRTFRDRYTLSALLAARKGCRNRRKYFCERSNSTAQASSISSSSSTRMNSSLSGPISCFSLRWTRPLRLPCLTFPEKN